MNILNSLEEILQFYGQKDSKHIYLDKTFNIEGIDYTNYIQLKFEDINNCNIKNIYTIDGWYILFYLMSNAYQAQYITTTIQIINKETGISHDNIKKILKHLQNINIIKVQEKSIAIETILHIAIGYNNSKINTLTKDGYRAIPVEYIKTILPTISSKEWAILTVLLVKYSYFTTTESINEETGEFIYNYTVNHYAFPKQDQIAEIIGVNPKTVRTYIKKLEKNKYKIISVWKGNINKSNIKNQNCRYDIVLLERVEYIYYHIYNTTYNRDLAKTELVNKLGFEKIAKSPDQYILNSQDYIKFKFQDNMDLFKYCLDANDKEKYKAMNKTISY